MKAPRPYGYLLVLMFVFMAAACNQVTMPTLPEEQAPQVQPSIAPTVISSAAVEAARQALAQQLGVEATQLEIFSAEARQFTDSCLGLPQEGESCSEVVVSGYQGVILGEGVQYEFRVSEDGSILRFLPGAALSAQQVLAAQLGLLPDEVRILSFERVDWPDACLGIETPGLMCAQVITPGFRILLEVDGKRYEFHTDLSGSDVRLALVPNLERGDAIVSWQAEEGGMCVMLLLQEEVLSYGDCEQGLTSIPFVGRERRQEMQMFIEKYAPFEAQTPSGKIVFRGRGAVTATSTEQRMLAEWARQIWMEHDPQAETTSPVVIAFHREGGLAGICEDVLIYSSGIAELSSCRPGQQLSVQRIYLTAAQMQEIYRWLDTYLPFESAEGDTNTPDSLSLRMVFNGKGQQDVSDPDRREIIQFVQEIADQAGQVQDPASLDAAKQALVAYFEALKSGDYRAVVELYGGSYDVLKDMNQDISPDDHFALWARACEQNGFVCDLQIKNWVNAAQLSPEEFRLTVELQNPDGTLFVLGPCCGAEVENFPPLTQFDFVIRRDGEIFLVQSLPVFVP
ncbi:MAG: hypothetical protein Kow0088_07990 [Anaerolineales bacterium]